MTNRERFRKTIRHEPADRGVFWPDSPWGATRKRWLVEGMPEDADFRFDRVSGLNDHGVDFGYVPAWDTGVVRDEGDHELVRNQYGILERVAKDAENRGVVQYVEFPVAGRTDWERLKPRLDAEAPGRFPAGWNAYAATKNAGDDVVVWGGTHLCGFFSFVRELVGDEEVLYLLYDDPALVRDMVSFQLDRLTTLLRRAATDLRIDCLFIWEDMCYKNGPLISPAHFREFFLEPYSRYIEAARGLGIEAIDVDSDGNVSELLPLWIEAGVTMNHPFEVQAGMDVVALRRRFGDSIVLRGGIDKRQLAADRAAIDREVERVRPAFEAGGYIPCADHSIPPDVPYENFLYYLDKRRELIGLHG